MWLRKASNQLPIKTPPIVIHTRDNIFKVYFNIILPSTLWSPKAMSGIIWFFYALILFHGSSWGQITNISNKDLYLALGSAESTRYKGQSAAMLQTIQLCGNNFRKAEERDDLQFDKVIYNWVCPSFKVTAHPEAGLSESSKVRAYYSVVTGKIFKFRPEWRRSLCHLAPCLFL
jgi:hypothetical protein